LSANVLDYCIAKKYQVPTYNKLNGYTAGYVRHIVTVIWYINKSGKNIRLTRISLEKKSFVNVVNKIILIMHDVSIPLIDLWIKYVVYTIHV